MVTRQQHLDTSIDFLVSTKVGNIHDVQQGGLRKVHSPRRGDYLRIISLSYSQVLMWGEHVIDFAISKVEVAKIQRCNLILVCLNCAYPLWKVLHNQGVFKISGHAISIYCVTQRWDIGG
jgi:hypothetical protein